MVKLIVGVNDLATVNPELVKEWNFERNGDLKPTGITAGSGKKVWWLCKQHGHSWQVSISHRSNGTGCPYCANQKVWQGFNDLATTNPELVEEWDYTKNGDLKPTDVTANSNKKAWWLCKEHKHSWEAKVCERSKGCGCPYCSGHQVLKGFNDLATKNPDLAEEWNYEKNGNLKPTDVTVCSEKKVWWKCKKGHLWETMIKDRSKGNGCPYCSGRNAIQGETDLLTTNSTLAEEWDYEKNGDLKPTDVTAGSGKKVWWLCKKGHLWEAPISNRSKGSGCPYCSGRNAIIGETDLVTTNPTLVEEWDYEKNGNLKPTDVTAGSSKKVWWLCKKHRHSYSSSINQRTYKLRGCPYCSNQKVFQGFNDLATTNPDLAKEWDFEKNGDLKPTDVVAGSEKKVWWKCKKGHSWEAMIKDRSRGRGCPICNKESQTSFAEQAVFYFIHQYFPDTINRYKFSGQKELDIFIPSKNFAIEYDGRQWHKNTQKDITKDKECKNQKIQLIRIREIKNDEETNHDQYKNFDCMLFFHHSDNDSELSEIIEKILVLYLGVNLETKIDVDACRQEIYDQYIKSEKENSFASKFPEIAKEWDFEKNGDLKPELISCSSSKKFWWKCVQGHLWEAPISSRSKGSGCPYCSNKKVLKGFNDLITTNPVLAEEWDYKKNGNLKPTDVTAGSGKKVWWLCKKHKHSWQTIIASRSNGCGCPFCSGQQVLKGFNDLATKNPALIEEWDYEKNGNLKPTDVILMSAKKVWWQCKEYGHSYSSYIVNRTKGDGCPICSGHQVLKGFNDLATINPELIQEWDYEKNENLKPTDVTAGSNKKVWWLCKKHKHSWQAIIASRSNGCGCPVCSKNKTVICLETNEQFESITKAATEHGLKRRSISNCCTGKQKTAGGYHWKYAVDADPSIQE